MKKLGLIFIVLLYSTLASATQTLLTHECKNASGEKSVNLHVSEELFCATDISKPFSAYLVVEEGLSPQALIMGEVGVIDNGYALRFSAKATFDNQDFEFMSLETSRTDKATLKTLEELDPVSYSEEELTCTVYQYNIEC